MKSKGQILIITDFKNEMEDLIYKLSAEGYKVEVTNIFGSFKAVETARPIIIIADYRDTDTNMVNICKFFRGKKELVRSTIIVVSDINEENILIKTLDAGADFYLIKPVSCLVLVTKINSIQKRFYNYSDSVKQVGDIIIDKERYLVICRNNSFTLPPREFEIVSLLISEKEKVFLRNELLSLIWKNSVDLRTVDVHIHKIRKKLGLNFIKTIKGVGYKIAY